MPFLNNEFIPRILPDIEDSIKMVKEFESVGISAIAVHGRMRHQTSNEPLNKGTMRHSSNRTEFTKRFPLISILSHSDAIRQIVESVRIPVIANGASNEIESFEDIEQFRNDCGAASVMIARAAQKNISIFRKEGEIVKVRSVQ